MGDKKSNDNIIEIEVKELKSGKVKETIKTCKIDPTFFEENGDIKKVNKNKCRGANYLLSCIKNKRVDFIESRIIKALAIACWNDGYSKRINNGEDIKGYTAEVRNIYGYFTNDNNSELNKKINEYQSFFANCCLNGSKQGMVEKLGQQANLIATNINMTQRLNSIAKETGTTISF